MISEKIAKSEIADAEQAIAKIELLARYWWRLVDLTYSGNSSNDA